MTVKKGKMKTEVGNHEPMPLGGTISFGNKQSKPASTSKVIYGDDLRSGRKDKKK